ncbi:hypothetical protein OF83DRAFT_814567 [Amylostereum chailletii]|nr:hypothetical protein OF83DRAFT_814567 [Amylostereum chailletii]
MKANYDPEKIALPGPSLVSLLSTMTSHSQLCPCNPCNPVAGQTCTWPRDDKSRNSLQRAADIAPSDQFELATEWHRLLKDVERMAGESAVSAGHDRATYSEFTRQANALIDRLHGGSSTSPDEVRAKLHELIVVCDLVVFIGFPPFHGVLSVDCSGRYGPRLPRRARYHIKAPEYILRQLPQAPGRKAERPWNRRAEEQIRRRVLRPTVVY